MQPKCGFCKTRPATHYCLEVDEPRCEECDGKSLTGEIYEGNDTLPGMSDRELQARFGIIEQSRDSAKHASRPAEHDKMLAIIKRVAELNGTLAVTLDAQKFLKELRASSVPQKGQEEKS